MNTSNPYFYRNVAKQLGVRFLFGHWGVQRKGLRIRFIPLDGWIFDKDKIVREMKKRNFEL